MTQPTPSTNQNHIQNITHYQFERIVLTVFNNTPSLSCYFVGHIILGYYVLAQSAHSLQSSRYVRKKAYLDPTVIVQGQRADFETQPTLNI